MLTTGQIKSGIGNIMAALSTGSGLAPAWKMRNEFMVPDGDDKSTKSNPIRSRSGRTQTHHSGDHTREPKSAHLILDWIGAGAEAGAG